MNKRILVADDDPAILDSIKTLLEDEGYRVDVTVDGEAVKMVNKTLPDLILLDIWMSGLDGREIVKSLRQNRLTASIPIILFSANRDVEKMCIEAGADDFLAKPFEAEDLLKKIGRLLAVGKRV